MQNSNYYADRKGAEVANRIAGLIVIVFGALILGSIVMNVIF